MCDQDHFDEDRTEFEARGLVTRRQFGMLVGVGVAMLNSPYALRDSAQLVPIGLFLFGIGLTLGGFIPEAIKAKRLLVGALGPPMIGVIAGVGR